MNYDAMSVHDLVMEIYYAGAEIASDKRQMAESALRKAVIREASVGVGTVRRLGLAPLLGAPEMDVSCETKDGDYDLIPHKEIS